MRIDRSMGLITLVTMLSAATLVLLLLGIPSVSAQTGTPPSSSISSSSGPVSWDFGPVVAASRPTWTSLLSAQAAPTTARARPTTRRQGQARRI